MTVKVLFVCLGNICRSPTAEGVFTHLVKDKGHDNWIEIDSAGTHAYHVGSAPDKRAQQAARNRGIELGSLRGRQAVSEDLHEFDYILAMDHENYHNLIRICPDDLQHKVSLFLDFASGSQLDEVPDPYYGGASGFEQVLDLVEEASRGLLDHILKQHSS